MKFHDILLLMVVVSFILAVGSISWNLLWYSVEYIEWAPDGYYEVYATVIDMDKHTVFFPMCDCERTDLQGEWSFASGVTWPQTSGWFRVHLVNNIIVSAEIAANQEARWKRIVVP